MTETTYKILKAIEKGTYDRHCAGYVLKQAGRNALAEYEKEYPNN